MSTTPTSKRFITLELIRKRTKDHDNLCLLKDISDLDVHQDHLQEIGSVVMKTCPNLKRLYLHNNLLVHLDELNATCTTAKIGWKRTMRVLVVALNHLTTLRSLEHYDALEYIDASFNAIDIRTTTAIHTSNTSSRLGLLESLDALKGLPRLHDLFLAGNPCQHKLGGTKYRSLVIATLLQLKRLDGITIEADERTKAIQDMQQYHGDDDDDDDDDCNYDEEQWNSTTSTTTTTNLQHDEQFLKIAKQRHAMSEEWLALQARIEKDRQQANVVHESNKNNTPRLHSTVLQETRTLEQPPFGERRNVNEPNYPLTLDYHMDRLILVISIPKEIPTEDLDLDIKMDYISLVVQAQVVRVRLPQTICQEKAQAHRSQATGKLELNLPTREKIVILDDNDCHSTARIQNQKLLSFAHTATAKAISTGAALMAQDATGQSAQSILPLQPSASKVRTTVTWNKTTSFAVNDHCTQEECSDDEEPPTMY